jgi:farnesyl-diphosphate farnesyltransferase
VSYSLQKYIPGMEVSEFTFDWFNCEKELPEVTTRLAEWIMYCPESIRARIADSTSSMAERMAFWAERNWKI